MILIEKIKKLKKEVVILVIFSILAYYLLKNNEIIIQNMKRTSRRLSSETKQKISTALRNKPKTERHRQALSIALKKYWQTIPYEESVMES